MSSLVRWVLLGKSLYNWLIWNNCSLEELFEVDPVTGICAGISSDLPYYRHRCVQTPSLWPPGSILLGLM